MQTLIRKNINRVRKTYGLRGLPLNRFQGNDTSAFVPEKWAAEAIYILNENMRYGGMVSRNYDPLIANFGDTINIPAPASFVAKRKQNDLDDLVDQDVTASTVQVVLNQRMYVSFVLGDAARSLSFADLVNIYLREAVIANARLIDQCVGAQVYQFLSNGSGQLGGLTKTNAHDQLLGIRKVFNDNKAGESDRWLGLASKSETAMQQAEIFKAAYSIGDSGQALRDAFLGRVAGWNTVLELNTPSVSGATVATSSLTVAGGVHSVGSTVVNLNANTSLVTGMYLTIAGDMTPLRITSIDTNAITVNRPTKTAFTTSATTSATASGLVNQASAIAAGDKTLYAATGYPAGWMKEIIMDGTAVPHVGQLVAFKAVADGSLYTPEYCCVQVRYISANNYGIVLDRPLVNAVLNNDIINFGPDGDYNFALQKNAVALVNRPLALPPADSGVRAAIGYANGAAIRVAITWDGKSEGTRVTVSGLFGVAVLDSDLGGVLYG
jgi:hypothetical protein